MLVCLPQKIVHCFRTIAMNFRNKAEDSVYCCQILCLVNCSSIFTNFGFTFYCSSTSAVSPLSNNVFTNSKVFISSHWYCIPTTKYIFRCRDAVPVAGDEHLWVGKNIVGKRGNGRGRRAVESKTEIRKDRRAINKAEDLAAVYRIFCLVSEVHRYSTKTVHNLLG